MNKPVLLVAEDNHLDAILMERLVERSQAPLRMMRVENGEGVINYLEGTGAYADRANNPPADLLLLDLKMPRKDGFAVLRWRRDNPSFSRLPIIVFSSSNLKEDITQAYSLGANSYVVKPTDPLRLESMIKALHAWWCGFNVTPTRS